jgi:2-(1,2-epoxy-1,2-dihydrophenyl)acetyl-CoA isomerase
MSEPSLDPPAAAAAHEALFERRGAVALLTLNRPDKLNSFTRTMHRDIGAALDQVERDGGIRALVVTGAGRGFCAGQDLAGLDLDDVGDLHDVIYSCFNPLVLRLQRLRVPTLAAVNGVAAGAGASLAMCCDIAIAAESASFVQAFSKIGLVPDTGGTWFLPQRLGLPRALALAMTGDKLPARQAAEWGLVWQCVPDAELLPTTLALAERLAAMPTRALVATRALLRDAGSRGLAEQLDQECLVQTELGLSHDYREGVAAFNAKRAPRFTGQ